MPEHPPRILQSALHKNTPNWKLECLVSGVYWHAKAADPAARNWATVQQPVSWWGSKSVQKGIRGLGADGRCLENGWITAVTEVFNNLDRIRQNTEDNLHVAALCFVGNTSAHPGSSQAVLTAGFQKNKGRSSVKREGDPWQSSGTKLREQPPLTPSRDVKALCPSRTTPWETVQPGFLPVLYIPEFNRNKPLVGTLREKQFKTSRHSGEMIINQTPIQSCIFLRRAEQKKRWQIMHVCEAMYQIHLCYHCLLDTSEDEFKLPITL